VQAQNEESEFWAAKAVPAYGRAGFERRDREPVPRTSTRVACEDEGESSWAHNQRLGIIYSMPNPFIEKLREEKGRIKNEVRSRTVAALTTALGLVAGLAWNNAINALITEFFPSPGKNILALFIYAFLLTIVVAIFAYYLNRLFSPPPDNKQ
jgi:hypothetical protein